MQIGFVVALPREATSLLKASAISLAEPLSLDDNLLVVSGMGVRAAQAAAELLAQRQVSALVSWGTAAALVPELSAGTVVVPTKIVGAEAKQYPTTRQWQQCLVNKLNPLLSVVSGTLAEAGTVLHSRAQKLALHHSSSGAVACDMESAAVARIAERTGLPFLAIRAIVDSLELSLPSELAATLDAFGEPRLAQLAAQLCRHPGRLRPLLKLSGAFHLAVKNLALVYASAGSELGYTEP